MFATVPLRQEYSHFLASVFDAVDKSVLREWEKANGQEGEWPS